ncbi:heavy-metal-associated domain-containing protein [Tenacibaculum sp. SG-28]|uniref:heavy-metal-associated domain-containing protein n=1 Tax=Tenacibaculum sp. SG-28 TaxID=754426 RepID=UPI000CF43CC6|nr:heavy-metal-associated domain-containing protein [Tenacibaculum sp. SG-28]PQJ21197.1 hypothetical protein BSU00_09435 [Tenacibaculum sp. SG-28]
MEIFIENLKCGGCAATIQKELEAMDGVSEVTVDVNACKVMLTTSLEKSDPIVLKLAKLGYPEQGSTNTVLHKAKSFVSCATGRLQNT